VVFGLDLVSLSLSGVEADLVRELSRLPRWFSSLLVSVGQIMAVLAPVAGIGTLIVMRRYRRAVSLVLAAVVGGVLGRLVLTSVLHLDVGQFGVSEAFQEGVPFPTGPFMAALATMVASDAPWMTRRWRHASRWWLLALVLLRLLSGASGLRELLVAVVVGWTFGTVITAILGAPDRRPSNESVQSALVRLGVAVSDITHTRSAGGRHHYRVTSHAGHALWVEVAARDGWETMLPGRLYRALRFRDPADGRPFASIRELTEHEALATLKARGDGVPTLEIEAVGEIEPGAYLLAYRAVDGSLLANREDIGPEVLPAIWSLVSKLRMARVAHRGLNEGAILVVGPTNELVVMHFDTADLTGDERVLASDVAEVLAWTAHRFGVDPTVDAAVAALGPGPVARSLPRLQPLALTRATRPDVADGLLGKIAERVRERTGADRTDLAPIERIKPRNILTAVMLVVALNALVPQLAGAGKVWTQLADARWSFATVAVLMSIGTYLGSAIALAGSVAEPVPFGPNVTAQVAASFVAIAAPAQVGAMAVKGRFLQRRGIDPAVAVAAVGLNTVAAFLVHLALTAAFFIWAGTGDIQKIRLPSSTLLLTIAGAVVVLLGITLALPPGRKFLKETVLPMVRRSFSGIAEVARQPARLAGLLGGSAMVTMCYLLAMVASVAAFRGEATFPAVALVYLLGAIVQSAAPTPGGLGAAEAAYIGGMTAIGVPSDKAIAATLLFRLVTFWMPIIPGWFSWNWLQRNDAV
jgi:undecaprenyl-diphosphatase